MPKNFIIALATLMLLVSLFTPLSSVMAEDLVNNDGNSEIIEVSDAAINVKMEIYGQSYPDKDITFKVTITPKIDIARAQLSWIYDSDLFTITEPTQVIELDSGKELVLYGTFKINKSYKFSAKTAINLGVKIAGSAYDKNYLSITKVPVYISSDYELTPILDSYQTQKNTITTLYVLLGMIGTGIIIWLVVLGVRRFKRYLAAD
jgi:hypothetical protein